MVKVKYTAFMADARGKNNGSVFSKNRSGAYVRTKVTPSNPQTASQAQARSRLTGFSQGWRGLTEAQRDQWSSAAPNFPRTNQFGDQYILTGQQLFVSLNTNLVNVGETQIDTPPTPGESFALTAAAVAMVNGTPSATLTFSPSPIPAGFAVLVFATPGMSPGKNFAKSQYRLIRTLPAATTTTFAMGVDYIAKFGGIPAAGQKVFFKLVPVNTDTGQQGQEFVTVSIVAA